MAESGGGSAGGEYGDAGYGEQGDVEQEALAGFQELHDQGVIDLDGPARQMIDVVEKRFRERFDEEGAEEEGELEGDGYWIVGSRGPIHHRPRLPRTIVSLEGTRREAIEQRIGGLQDVGMVDLDAPLRDAIPELARNMVKYRSSDSWWIISSGDDPHAVCECPSTETPDSPRA
jgi:hypothetical protein